MNCRTGCPTGDHASWGACARAANLKVGWAASAKGIDLTNEKQWQRDLQAYSDAVDSGIQPETTQRRDVDKAVVKSNETGQAFKAF